MSEPRAPADLAAILREWEGDDGAQQTGEDRLYTPDEWADALAGWLAARGVRVVPEGAVVVPLEPTPEMIDVGLEVLLRSTAQDDEEARLDVANLLRAALRQAGGQP